MIYSTANNNTCKFIIKNILSGLPITFVIVIILLLLFLCPSYFIFKFLLSFIGLFFFLLFSFLIGCLINGEY